MRNLILLGFIVISLTGCQSLKYCFDQTFGDQREHGVFLSKDNKPVPEDNLAANMDNWVKNHLW